MNRRRYRYDKLVKRIEKYHKKFNGVKYAPPVEKSADFILYLTGKNDFIWLLWKKFLWRTDSYYRKFYQQWCIDEYNKKLHLLWTILMVDSLRFYAKTFNISNEQAVKEFFSEVFDNQEINYEKIQ